MPVFGAAWRSSRFNRKAPNFTNSGKRLTPLVSCALEMLKSPKFQGKTLRVVAKETGIDMSALSAANKLLPQDLHRNINPSPISLTRKKKILEQMVKLFLAKPSKKAPRTAWAKRFRISDSKVADYWSILQDQIGLNASTTTQEVEQILRAIQNLKK